MSRPLTGDGDAPRNAATRREPPPGGGDGATRRETPAGGANGATRREAAAPGADGATRRDQVATPGTRATRRLQLPDSVASAYEYVRDLTTAGGEADIALLRDRVSGTEVIFKSYRPGMSPDPAAMRLLRGAARPHIVQLILSPPDNDDWTWEIQEYCPLGSMRDWVASRGGRLDTSTLKDAVREISEALAYLHGLGSGIAHRDLKPANVLVRTDRPLDLVLADFGLAKSQQQFTHLTTTVKGTWHYAAPEVHKNQSTAKSDWFSLGVMVYEFYTGQKLFAMADGTEVSEDDAKSRCLSHNYATDLIDDPRWKLLADGLLTWDKDHRWGYKEVSAWLGGQSPQVHDERAAGPSQPAVGYRPNWSPVLVSTPQELASQFRQHWDEAASELAGRPDPGMIRFLEAFPGLQDAVRIVKSGEAPGPKLVRLQRLLDPDGPIHYEGTPLDDTSLKRSIKAADGGDEAALNWLESMLKEHVLTAFAEVTGSKNAANADYLLGRWKNQADAVTKPLPADHQALARQAFRSALPQLFVFALSRGGGAA